MKVRVNKVLSAIAVSAAALAFANAAQATTVNFASTTTVADLLGDPILTYSSSGLNGTLTVGVQDDIAHFITATFGNNSFTNAGTDYAITASFVFTEPTPVGTTQDSGTILATARVNGQNGANASVQITWSDPVVFTFTDGTTLSVDLANTTYVCADNNCNNESFYIDGKFTALNGPADAPGLSTTPLPGALPLMVSGLGALGFVGWRRKKKTALRV
jgi:hypothetical protein